MQSNGTALLVSQLAPAALHEDCEMPVVGLVHLARLHTAPALAATQLPLPSQVFAQLPGAPHSLRTSVPAGASVQMPGALGSEQL